MKSGIMRIVMFKTQKPKRFRFKPRYFDPEEEAAEKRRKAREARLSEVGQSLRDEMSKKWHRKSKRKSNAVVLVYLALVILLIVYIFGR